MLLVSQHVWNQLVWLKAICGLHGNGKSGWCTGAALPH